MIMDGLYVERLKFNWSKYVEMILDGKGLTHHLTKEANTSDGNFTTWKPNDATIKAWLIGSMKLEFLNNYLMLPTTKTVWDKVKKCCLQQSND